MSPQLRTFSIKYVINWLPTGSRMELQGELVTQCIHCGLYEDKIHLLHCLKRKEKISVMLKRFSDELDKCKTDPKLKRSLMYQIAKYFREEKSVTKSNIQAHQTAIQEQEKLAGTTLQKEYGAKNGELYKRNMRKRTELRKTIGQLK